jgi:hypothetical protein
MVIGFSMRSLCGRLERGFSIYLLLFPLLTFFVEIREPGVIETFAKIWATKDLLVSFDGMNFTLPPGEDNKQIPQTQPWPHIDQDPLRKGMHCVQGILNFAPNGPKDGGLIVMKGSTNLMGEFFKAHPQVIGRPTWGTRDWFGFEKSEVPWFEERGCEIVKVCAEPGDVILWDSRTMHWNCVPETQNIRAIICESPLILNRCMLVRLI